MIILRNKLFSSSSNEEDKLTKAEKAAMATAIAGTGVAGFGQGYADAKKREYIKRGRNWYESREGLGKDVSKANAKFDWKYKKPYKNSRKVLQEDIARSKRLIDRFKDSSIPNKDRAIESFNHTIEQSKTLLDRKKGKTTAKAGAAAVAAGLGYLGYSEYKKHKKAKRNDNTKK